MQLSAAKIRMRWFMFPSIELWKKNRQPRTSQLSEQGTQADSSADASVR